MTENINILVVDDNPMVVEAMRQVIDLAPDMNCVGSAPTADDLVGQAQSLHPDVIMLDMRMPGRDPLDALSELSVALPEARIIVLSGMDDSDSIDRALDAGAWGFLSKGGDVERLLDAIRRVAGGEMVLPRA